MKLKAEKYVVYDWSMCFREWLESFDKSLVKIFRNHFINASYSGQNTLHKFTYKSDLEDLMFACSDLTPEQQKEKLELFWKNFGKFRPFAILFWW